MNINTLKYIKGAIVVLAFLFVIGVVGKIELLSIITKAIIFPLFVWLYITESETKSKFFTGFLVAFSLAEISTLIQFVNFSLISSIGNVLYIVGYICLLVYMAKGFNLSQLIKRFKTYLLVLIVFNTYIIFVLNQMILEDVTLQVYTFDFLIECTYNVCILLVLSFSLINYLYHDSKRGLLLFLTSVCIVFSEMVQVAYIFVSQEYVLNVAYSLLMVAGFYLVYVYIVSKMNKFYNLLS